MIYEDEQQLLALTKENNALLKQILRYIKHDDVTDFFTNIAANIIGNRIDGGNIYGRY